MFWTFCGGRGYSLIIKSNYYNNIEKIYWNEGNSAELVKRNFWTTGRWLCTRKKTIGLDAENATSPCKRPIGTSAESKTFRATDVISLFLENDTFASTCLPTPSLINATHAKNGLLPGHYWYFTSGRKEMNGPFDVKNVRDASPLKRI